jgi:hypothetical protein
LEKMVTSPTERQKAIKQTIISEKQAILACYKEKGAKGIQILEKVINSIEQKIGM